MKTAKSALILSGSSAANLVVRLVALAVLARLLEPKTFGAVALAVAIKGIISLVAQLDIRDALIQGQTVSRAHFRLVWQLMTATGCLSYAMIVGLSGWVEIKTGVNGISPVLRVIGLVIFFEVFLVPIEAMLIRRGGIKAIATGNFIAYAVGFLGVGVAASLLRPDAISLSLAYVAFAGVRNAFMAWMLYRMPIDEGVFGPSPKAGILALASDLMRFSVFGTANRFFTTSAKQIDNLIIGSLLGASELGFYSRAYTLSAAPIDTLLGATIRSVVFPSLARMQEDKHRFKLAVCNANAAGALVILPMSLGMCILAPDVINLVLGAYWEASIFPFQCLSIAMGLRFGPRLCVAIGRSLGQQRLIFFLNFGMTITLGLLVWLGAVTSGIDGAVVGVLISSVLQWWVSIWLSARLSDLRSSELLSSLVRPFAVSLVFAIVLFLSADLIRLALDIPALTILISGMLAAAVTFGALISFPNRLLSDWERGVICKLIRSTISDGPLRRFVLRRFEP